MKTTTMTLVEFLTARLDEDAQRSPHAMDAWHAVSCDTVVDPERSGGCDCGVPARVLREVELKRLLVVEHELTPYYGLDPYGRWLPHTGEPLGRYCEVCGCDDGIILEMGPCPTLRHLAAVYSDHRDFDEGWRA